MNRYRRQATRATAICMLLLAALPALAGDKKKPDNGKAPAIKFFPYKEALALGKKRHQRVVLCFSATWCGPCKRLHDETFSDNGVRKIAAHFVWGEIDVDQQPNLARKYNVQAMPYLVFLDAKGKQLGTEVGYRPPKPMIKLLQTYLAGKTLDQNKDARQNQPVGRAAPARSGDIAATIKAVAKLATSSAKDRKAARQALLKQGTRAWPGLVASLADQRLAVRAAGYDVLVDATGQHLPFNAFAKRATRDKQVAAWRRWLDQKLPERSTAPAKRITGKASNVARQASATNHHPSHPPHAPND